MLSPASRKVLFEALSSQLRGSAEAASTFAKFLQIKVQEAIGEMLGDESREESDIKDDAPDGKLAFYVCKYSIEGDDVCLADLGAPSTMAEAKKLAIDDAGVTEDGVEDSQPAEIPHASPDGKVYRLDLGGFTYVVKHGHSYPCEDDEFDIDLE